MPTRLGKGLDSRARLGLALLAFAGGCAVAFLLPLRSPRKVARPYRHAAKPLGHAVKPLGHAAKPPEPAAKPGGMAADGSRPGSPTADPQG